MKFLKTIEIGLRAYGRAFGFLSKHNLWYYLLVPLVLNVILFLLSFHLTWYLSGQISRFLQELIHQDSWIFFGSDVLVWLFNFFIGAVLYFILFIIFSYISGYLILILMSPLLAYLSEKVEEILSGEKNVFSMKQFLKDTWRGILINLRNLGIELLLMVFFFIFSWIPIIGWLSFPGLFLVTSYYYGFSFTDYTLERKGKSIAESSLYARRNKTLMITNGIPFTLTMMIPFIGVKISTFTAVLSTIAASIAAYENA